MSLFINGFSLLTATGHPWSDQGAPRAEPQDGGPSPRPLLHLHTLRTALPPRDPAQGGHVQVKAQTRLHLPVHGPKVRNKQPTILLIT